MTEPGFKLHIAISGGGISGLSLARGLSQYPHLRVTIFEATQKFLDIGGGLALHGNALRALESIDPALLTAYFEAATPETERDVEMATVVSVASGKHAGAVLAEIGKARGRKTVARADLLAGLLGTLEGRGVDVRFGKRLAHITELEADGGVEMTFKDGTTAQADVLIGCDGVKSATRRYLLGEGHPALEPRNHDGWVWIRRNVPAEEVRALNPKLLDSVPIFCGNGGMINCMPLHFGRTLNLAVVQAPSDAAMKTQQRREASESFAAEERGVQEVADPVLAENFKDWTQDARDVVELGLRDPITDWKLADHDPAPYYSKGPIAIAGDAAHATLPFAGQGAGQSLEDGAVLTALFKHVSTREEAERALKAYDAVRKPRSQNVVELSREYGRVYAFMHPGAGDNLGRIRGMMYEGEVFASGIDIEEQNRRAVDMFFAREGTDGEADANAV